MAQPIEFRAEFFKEGAAYVGLAPELDVSSFGDTLAEAREALVEAVEAFLEGCEALGTLHEVLEEAGFHRQGDRWLARRPIEEELLTTR